MNDSRSKLKALVQGFPPVYILYYYIQNGEIIIFSGGKFYPENENEARQGNHIYPCIGNEKRSNIEVIAAYEKREQEAKERHIKQKGV